MTIKEILKMEEQMRDGPFEKRNQSGKLIERGTYKNGKLDGEYKKIEPNGRIRIITYKDGKLVKTK